LRAPVLICALLLLSSPAALAQFSQDGPKLVGSLAANPAQQGFSVALSADGATAIVGGIEDNVANGAAWVFTHSGDVWTQQSGKLVGTGADGDDVQQGRSVALSADGDTAIVGGPQDNGGQGIHIGAAWLYTRSGGVWSQQGGKRSGTGAVGASFQGYSVALSADGNTAIVGGPTDNCGNCDSKHLTDAGAGALWVFTRSGGVWSQQGAKLVGTGSVGQAGQGFSAALSADGNTAIVGGWADNSYTGAAWVFVRSGGVWTQQGGKLVGTGAIGQAGQGSSVALSADGDTALVGGPGDNSNAGATWVFTRRGAVWRQQGKKLIGTGALGASFQGHSVALSADGHTAIAGGPGDNPNSNRNSSAGAAWVFTHNGVAWTQQGAKRVGIGSLGQAAQGFSVSLSGDGAAAIVGGLEDNSGNGAAWVFVQPLAVSPYTSSAASGTQGGPFSPSSFSYTLSATSGSMNYWIDVPAWLTASSTSGTATKSGKTITFEINSSADELAPGAYLGVIAFYNADIAQESISRAATLTVNP
jgi:hypothetical protein